MAVKNSSTSSSRAARGAWFALAIVAMLNLAVGVAPGFWLAGRAHDVFEYLELERRVERYPHREAVEVLVLGNSHGQTGLRPPDLARRLALPEHSVFSLTLPGSNPHEVRMLIERFADRFPHARLAICNVDVAFLNWQHEVRMRYITRHLPADRWQMATAERDMESRLGMMLGLAFPFFDFKETLRAHLQKDPFPPGRTFADRIRLLAAADYPWGVPIFFEQPELFGAADRSRLQSTRELLQRAKSMTISTWRIPQRATELEALDATLEARGIELALIELPVPAGFAAALEVHARSSMARYRRAVAEVVERRKIPMLTAPALPSLEYYYDGDHLSAEGAASVAATLGGDPTLRKLIQR